MPTENRAEAATREPAAAQATDAAGGLLSQIEVHSIDWIPDAAIEASERQLRAIDAGAS